MIVIAHRKFERNDGKKGPPLLLEEADTGGWMVSGSISKGAITIIVEEKSKGSVGLFSGSSEVWANFEFSTERECKVQLTSMERVGRTLHYTMDTTELSIGRGSVVGATLILAAKEGE